MQIIYRHIEVINVVKNDVDEKIGKVSNYFNNIISAKVIFGVEKGYQVVKAIIIVPDNQFVVNVDDKDKLRVNKCLDAYYKGRNH